MADLLSDVMRFSVFAVLGLFGVYLTLRIGTMAVLKSIDDFRKQQLAKEG